MSAGSNGLEHGRGFRRPRGLCCFLIFVLTIHLEGKQAHGPQAHGEQANAKQAHRKTVRSFERTVTVKPDDVSYCLSGYHRRLLPLEESLEIGRASCRERV